MPDTNIIMVLAVSIIAMVFFVSGKLRVDLTALCVLATLFLLGLIKSEDVLYGFSNPATATVTAMFVISAGLARTGLVQWLAQQIDFLAGIGNFKGCLYTGDSTPDNQCVWVDIQILWYGCHFKWYVENGAGEDRLR